MIEMTIVLKSEEDVEMLRDAECVMVMVSSGGKITAITGVTVKEEGDGTEGTDKS